LNNIAKVSLGYYVQRGHGILANFENEMEVAIKEVKKGTITERKMIKGLEPWAKIRNLNVIEIIGLCPRLDNKLPLIIMECGKGGTLKEFIRKINFSIPEKIIAKWAYQIAAGMAG
jgi:serine/threonine protein kinase